MPDNTKVGFPMMKKLRGRNLAHPGCLIGVTTGLTLGIIIAGVMAMLNIDLNTDLLTWLGLTLGLGALGWIIGDRLSSRFPALEEENLVPASDVDTEEKVK
jgi:hypothetical protein